MCATLCGCLEAHEELSSWEVHTAITVQADRPLTFIFTSSASILNNQQLWLIINKTIEQGAWAICFFYSHSGGWSPNRVHSSRRPLTGRLYLPGWLWWWRIWWNEDWQGKPKYSEKTCPSATWSTTNPTWPDPGSNPGRRGGKPATNRLSYDTAMSHMFVWLRIRIIESLSMNWILSFKFMWNMGCRRIPWANLVPIKCNTISYFSG
jgi:hypothetical protein